MSDNLIPVVPSGIEPLDVIAVREGAFGVAGSGVAAAPQVRVDAEDEDFLDWEAPYTEQSSKVQRALQRLAAIGAASRVEVNNGLAQVEAARTTLTTGCGPVTPSPYPSNMLSQTPHSVFFPFCR